MAAGRVIRDVVFASLPGYRPLTLDLHLPAADGVPVIVFVHGGGWRVGSKAVFCPNISEKDSFERIVAAGFAVVSVDYRLSGEAHFPAQVDDVRAALAWVREAGDDYGLDASRILLWGESAGATLASLVALEPGSGILGVIDWYGPSNLTTMADRGTPEEAASSREAEWLGASALDEPELARRASPVFHAWRGAPPFHIEHGVADQFVPVTQSEDFAAALVAEGVRAEFIPVPGANHMWSGVDDTAPIMDRSLAFAASLI